MRLPVVRKRGAELSRSEVDAMNCLIRDVDPGLPENHLEEKHIRGGESLFYFLYREEILVAFQSFRHFWVPTPFSKKRLPVILAGASYKKADAGIYGIARRLGLAFLRDWLGPMWFLRRFVTVAEIVNPRLMEQALRFYPVVYPRLGRETPEHIVTFVEGFFKQYTHLALNLQGDLVHRDPAYTALVEITQKWAQLYRAKDNRINTFFIQRDVFRVEQERVCFGPNSIILIGFYSPWGALRGVFRRGRSGETG